MAELMSGAAQEAVAVARRAVSADAGRFMVLRPLSDAARLAFVADEGRRFGDDQRGVSWWPGVGMVAYGRTVERADQAAQAYGRLIQSDPDAGLDAFRALMTPAPVHAGSSDGPFTGEVALVTGAASGIGKACVESFLERGAAVAGLDINPAVAHLHDCPEYLGLTCDVTDEGQIAAAIARVVERFGGLDMVVLNAGVFPKGCNIADLDLDQWRRVMSVNLDSGLILLRAVYPLLRLAPRYGRVVVNGSRNVRAPGVGAAAYSCSKAGLTQLARIAALEWAKDGIRVNMLHAHMVVDTGLWTPEVLTSRAAHYGMTVDQYKRNNLLKVEVVSRDMAELAAEMCGPLFAKTTGAGLPVDGGNDRVI